MADDPVPPPRYTSTPLANRRTSDALKNFTEVSPIFSSTDKDKRIKSMIPILSTNDMRARSSGCRSIQLSAKSAVARSTYSSGQGSSGSVKIPPQVKKSDVEKNRNAAQASEKSAPEVLASKPRAEPQNTQQKTIDQADEIVILSLSPKETYPSQKETKISSIALQIEAVPAKTPVPEVVLGKKPQNPVDKVPTKCATKTKPQPQVSIAVPASEPRSSIDKVIDRVVKSLSHKETETLLQEFSSTQVPAKHSIQAKPLPQVPMPAKEFRSSIDEVIDSVVKSLSQKETETSPRKSNVQDVPRSNSNRVSRTVQRPSTLPSVPEEGSGGGSGQLNEDGIFKKSEAQSGWTIPKETKTRVSLKRKPSVPATVTKRHKKVETKNKQQDDDLSLFDSPELPNLEEISSLSKNRKTYLLKKKSVIPDIKEECQESVTDGIIPLEILSPKSSPNIANVSSKKGESSAKNNDQSASKGKEGVDGNSKKGDSSRKNIEQSASKGKDVEQRGKENVSSNFVDHTKNSNPTKSANQQKECVIIESPTSTTTESASKTAGKSINKGKKPKEPVKEKGTEASVPEQSNTDHEDDTNVQQSNEQKKKNIKSKKVETNENQAEHTESSKRETGLRRTLRERKPNVQYMDLSGIIKEKNKMDNRKSKVSVTKASQEQKENLKEPVKENKSQKKVVKGKNKKCNNSNSGPNELLTNPSTSKGPEETNDANNLTAPKKLISDTCSQDQEENNAPKKAKTTGKSKKDTEKKTKKASKTNVEVPVEGKENQIKSSEDRSVKPAEDNSCNNNQSCKVKSTNEVPEENLEIRKNIITKRTTTSQSRTKSKISEANEQVMKDLVNKIPEGGKIRRESESVVTTTGRKRRTEEMEINESQSESRFYFRDRTQRPIEFWKNQTGHSRTLFANIKSSSKRRKHDQDNSERASNDERAFSVAALLGEKEVRPVNLQPGIENFPAVHIHNFMMMGEVRLEPGTTLSKITTNTAYTVQEGSARVTISKKTKHFRASDKDRRFFVPRNFDVSITNDGDAPLKMDYVKFK